jgi:hypothetical protein
MGRTIPMFITKIFIYALSFILVCIFKRRISLKQGMGLGGFATAVGSIICLDLSITLACPM